MQRISTGVLLFILSGYAFAGPTPETPPADTPAFQVGNKRYNFKELCGCTEKELRERFAREVSRMSVEEVRKAVGSVAVDGTQDRAALEASLWRVARNDPLGVAARWAVLAAIAENIIQEQQIDPDDYFDLVVLREGIQRNIRYVDHLYTAVDDKGKDEELRQDLADNVGVKVDKKWWTESRNSVRRWPPVLRWQTDFVRKSPLAEDLLVKGVLAHALLAEVCEKGTYFREGTAAEQFVNSVFRVYDVTGYQGERAALQEFCKQVVDPQGGAAEQGMVQLIDFLQRHAPGVKVDSTVASGIRLAGDEVVLPPVGRLYESAPGRYRILAWQRKAPAVGLTENQAKAIAIGSKMRAYRLAALDYLPTAESYIEGFTLDTGPFARLLHQDILATLIAPIRPVGRYVKKPYPADVFDAFKAHRGRLQGYAVEACRCVLTRDAARARKLVDSLRAAAREPLPAPLQRRYHAIAVDLAARLKIGGVPKD